MATIAVALGGAACLAGCDMDGDGDTAAEETGDALEETGDAIEEGVEETGDAVEEAGDDLEDGMDEADDPPGS